MENLVNTPIEPTLEPGNAPEDLLPETAPEIVPTPQPQIPAIAVIVLIIFILLAFGTVVFFYLQNKQLKNMLLNYQNQNIIPTPTLTFTPTEEITPTASISATPTTIVKTTVTPTTTPILTPTIIK